ncbi:MAG: hypothetical protein QM662_00035 [Gordonia sp. (in: high G+C Gram-positive bacteria)]
MKPSVLRRLQQALLVVGVVLTVMAGAIVVAAYRNDAAIEADMGVVMADVVSADELHAVVYFQTPDGQIRSPKLGLLYPTELVTGQRISVEYDRLNPDLARPAGRDARLAIVPAASVVALTWVVIGVLMVALAEANRRWLRWSAQRAAGSDSAEPDGAAGADEVVNVR